MSAEDVNDLEDFQECLRIYARSLRILSHDPAAQCEEMGNYNVPWEIQHDVALDGQGLIRTWPYRFTEVQVEHIRLLAEALMRLPREAIAPPNMLTDNYLGSIAAMEHPAWDHLRTDAKRLLDLLRMPME